METAITPIESTAKAHRGAHAMSIINVTLILVGAYAGKTVTHKRLDFVDGRCDIQGTPRAIESIATYYGRCYQAYIEGSPELKAAQEAQDGAGETDADAGGGTAEPIPSGDGSDGAGSTTESPDDGSGSTEGDGGDAGISAAGDGQSDTRIPQEDPFKERLYQAVMSLDKGNDEHWSADTLLPRIDAVEAAYGSAGVTREDVEEVAPGITRETMPDPSED